MSTPVKARASEFAKAILSLKGRQLSFDNYKPWELIYDISPRFMVLIAGRQIGKSVSLGGRSVTQSVARKFFNSLYVAPFQIQAKRFSNAYLDPFVDSPIIKKHYKAGGIKNVYEKSFSTGSIIYLSYAQDATDADRIRGIMADQLMIDEVQDVLASALTPIFEVTSASPYGYKIMSGTAKSTSNILELLWQDTCKFEWIVKCHRCGYWNIPNTYEACMKICELPHGPSCIRCHKVIDMGSGKWVATRPSVQNRIGFHLPQFIMTSNTSEKKWPDLYDKVRQALNNGLYSPAKLSNEVFGLSTDLAGKTLSVSEVMACCNESQAEWYQAVPAEKHFTHVILGVDWSVTGSVISYTVASVIGYTAQGKMTVIYSEKFQGIDIISQIDRIENMYHKYRCDIIGSDRGVGVVQVQTLQRRLGFKKVVAINYVSAKVSVRYDTPGQFIAADRTRAIDGVIMKIRQGRERFETPSYQLTKPLWQDGLNIYEEETSVGSRVYRHHPEETDDWLHSLVFANVAYQYAIGDFSFNDETDVGKHTPLDDFFEKPVHFKGGYEDID